MHAGADDAGLHREREGFLRWTPITPIINRIVPSLTLSSTTAMPVERVHIKESAH